MLLRVCGVKWGGVWGCWGGGVRGGQRSAIGASLKPHLL